MINSGRVSQSLVHALAYKAMPTIIMSLSNLTRLRRPSRLNTRRKASHKDAFPVEERRMRNLF
jgi:hypothetical protein